MNPAIHPNRRDVLATIPPIAATLVGLLIPGCADERAKVTQEPPDTISGELRRVIQKLPVIDPAIGSKVSQTIVPGSEKLLVVVRYGHTSDKALQEAGKNARQILLEAREQAAALLMLLSSHLEISSLTGDGLLPENAGEFNRAFTYLKTTKTNLGELVRFSSAPEAITALKHTRDSMGQGEPRREKLTQLIAVLEKDETFGRVLKTFAETEKIISNHAAVEPLIRVAYEKGLTLVSTEDPSLHAKVLSEAHGNHDDEVIRSLNEAREDAIMDAIAQSGSTVTILCMGAMHRFEDNARHRITLPPAQRISVIEYNPRALPDDLNALLEAMTR